MLKAIQVKEENYNLIDNIIPAYLGVWQDTFWMYVNATQPGRRYFLLETIKDKNDLDQSVDRVVDWWFTSEVSMRIYYLYDSSLIDTQFVNLVLRGDPDRVH